MKTTNPEFYDMSSHTTSEECNTEFAVVGGSQAVEGREYED